METREWDEKRDGTHSFLNILKSVLGGLGWCWRLAVVLVGFL